MGNSPQRRTTRTKKRPSAAPTAQKKQIEWMRMLGIGVGVLAVGGLLAIIAFSSDPVRGEPDGTNTVELGDPAHVEGPIDYGVAVPAGGPHNAISQNCGFYAEEIRPENALHSLEHGAVWITYRPDVSSEDLDALRRIADRRRKALISQVPDQAAPLMATAWGKQLELDSTSDPRLDQFLNEFEGSLSAPEPGGACTGGVGRPSA